MIIATAGHVDHGKTELIRALTGTDTDRLPEEKARGLSIDLGFAYQSLPGNSILGFVDVPGHEKFIRNMLAGVGGIDLGLLVVAADDGIMPQTLEHFAILGLLGIEQCMVAITKIDRVDGDRLLDVRKQVETLFNSAGQAAPEVFPLCAPDNHGIEPLKTALVKRTHSIRPRPVDGHFRMTIDRVFTVRGTGTVVTGMVLSGATGIDDQLVVSVDGSKVRVRGIHAHNQASERAQAGERCAINIAGRTAAENRLKRGDWLMHASLYAPTRRIDVDLQVLDSEHRSLKHWTATHLHIAAQHLPARVAVLCGGSIASGSRGLAQLVLEQDVFVVHGDRFVLRDQSAQRTIAGGRVIDPFSPKRGRARPTRIAALQAMSKPGAAEVIDALTGISEAGLPVKPFATTHNLTDPQMSALAESLALRRIEHPSGDWLFSAARWQDLLNRIETAISRFHQSKPELAGASLKDIQLAVKPYLDIHVLEQAVSSLLSEKRLARQGARVHLPSHAVQVSDQDRQLWARAATSLAPDSGSPLSLHQAAEAFGVDKGLLEKSLKNAVRLGEMVKASKNRYLPVSYAARLADAAELLAASKPDNCFTVAEYCARTETGRNFAIDLLEYFDQLGFTERQGNQRSIKRPAGTLFATDGK